MRRNQRNNKFKNLLTDKEIKESIIRKSTFLNDEQKTKLIGVINQMKDCKIVILFALNNTDPNQILNEILKYTTPFTIN